MPGALGDMLGLLSWTTMGLSKIVREPSEWTTGARRTGVPAQQPRLWSRIGTAQLNARVKQSSSIQDILTGGYTAPQRGTGVAIMKEP
mmetsp:Transcript_121028/g.222611  ORF Transcript_121028/g.222611 Transcript_121028/m.222611 type:complete len:88 (-) Transcript_121028:600-863(-)